MARTVDLRAFLSDFCVELCAHNTAYTFKRLGINIEDAVCARCTYPFTAESPPVKIAMVHEEEETYMLFCKHCDKYIRNA